MPGRKAPGRVMHDSYMTAVAGTAARVRLGGLIDTIRQLGEPVYVRRRGTLVAVIVDPEAYEQLVDHAEDAVDRAELCAARDDDYVPWDEVKGELGLI
jgi:PHD/YefM family antitoxin component YafN of YafNO toxin-antitoxin module